MVFNKKGASFSSVVAIFGAVLIALGFAWLIAQNWHQMPAFFKIILLLGLTSISYVVAVILESKGHINTSKALLALGALLYSLSIFLIAQIFSTDVSFQGQAWLWLLSWTGVIAASYVFKSSIGLAVGMAEFYIWLNTQYIAFMESSTNMVPPGILAFYYLSMAMLLFGLGIWHRIKKHEFSRVFQWWTSFYVLLFSYMLSFQIILPIMWLDVAKITQSSVLLLAFLLFMSIFIMVSAMLKAFRNKLTDKREISGFLIIIFILSFLVGLSSFVKGEINLLSMFLGAKQSTTLMLWIVWIFANIIFLASILAVIAYGSWMKNPRIINLGIFFFALDIITRYIGFIMDLWGYTSLSIVFITGGILLLAGGWFIERWRRKLVLKAKTR